MPKWVDKQENIFAWGNILFKEDSCPRTWVIGNWFLGDLFLVVQYNKTCCPSDGCFDGVIIPSLDAEFFYGDVLSNPANLVGYLMSELPIVAVVILEWSPVPLQ